ncbi:substrate-binding domain-containing protein [Massilia sp. HP4]|uniref:substrate-binding domain-containing protein n=1 Tax=Massilia sp. HP4 TaxID=2562316 RepID=UPI0010C0F32C|nr:substrate-binding domain-containing protein [Massilia sp. HP4]
MQRRSLLAVLLCAAFASPSVLAQEVIRLSTTTSTENSGLLKHLLPVFEAKTRTRVHVISVGTGKALELARNGDVDVTLVHAREMEDKFVEEGWGVDRRDVMYNDFIVVGPEADPARIKGAKDVVDAFKRIAATDVRFISRGDNSGTDTMEKGYWQRAAVKPQGANYVSAGLGMGEVLNMAAEMRAYTLTDRATYGAYKARTGLAIVVEGDKRMYNPYGIIAVNPAKHAGVNYKGAKQLIEWITSPEGQARIASFKPAGEQLFFAPER